MEGQLREEERRRVERMKKRKGGRRTRLKLNLGLQLFDDLVRVDGPTGVSMLFIRGEEPADAARLVDDAAGLRATREALGALGIGGGSQRALFRAVSAVLLLGDVHFTSDAGSDRRDGCSVGRGSPLARVAELLGVEESVLDGWLRFRMMQGGRTSTFSIALSGADAAETRDHIAKTIYHGIFSWLIAMINRRIRRIDDVGHDHDGHEHHQRPPPPPSESAGGDGGR